MDIEWIVTLWSALVVEVKTGLPFLGDPTMVFEAAGLRVGFLTLTYHNTGQTGNSKNYEGLEFSRSSGQRAGRKGFC